MTRGLSVLSLSLAGSCGGSSASEDGGDRIVVEWTGSDTGRLVGVLRVEWCDSLGMLELRGIRGDSGIALAVYPGDSLRSDSLPVVAPELAASRRPSAAVALRWFAETAVKGFQGRSGYVALERDRNEVSGRFEAAMHSINDGARLDLMGSFREARVVAAARGCGPR